MAMPDEMVPAVMPRPGEIFPGKEPIELNAGRDRVELTVVNTGDRAIQVGSHYHFFEVNRALVFDRPQALGRRLDIPAGTAIRFEPGQEHPDPVPLVAFGGARRVIGFANVVDGSVDARWTRQAAFEASKRLGFRWSDGKEPVPKPKPK
jgi:urease subunit beta